MYLLLCYRPDYDDYCRGCHMGSSTSEFDYFRYEQLEDAAKKAAALDVENKHKEITFDNWEVTLLVRGDDPTEDESNDFSELRANHFVALDAVKCEETAASNQRESEKTRAKLEASELYELRRLPEKAATVEWMFGAALRGKMHTQALIDGLKAQWQRERAESQMTLGKLIAALESMPPDSHVDGIDSPHSYRGYYSDLAFEPRHEKTTVSELLQTCRDTMGQVFEGYKGGDFVMGALTPLWVANYGCTGMRIMGLSTSGALETATDE